MFEHSTLHAAARPDEANGSDLSLPSASDCFVDLLWSAVTSAYAERYETTVIKGAKGSGSAAIAQARSVLVRRPGSPLELRRGTSTKEPLTLIGHDRVRFVTEWGGIVPPSPRSADPRAAVDHSELAQLLAQPHLLETLAPKLARMTVVFDEALYPFWVVGGRRHVGRAPGRPELGIHVRFLRELDSDAEARLYRAVTTPSQRRSDRRAGRRDWRGRAPAYSGSAT